MFVALAFFRQLPVGEFGSRQETVCRLLSRIRSHCYRHARRSIQNNHAVFGRSYAGLGLGLRNR